MPFSKSKSSGGKPKQSSSSATSQPLKATSQSSSKPSGHQPPKATTQSSSRATGQPPKATSQQATSQSPSKATDQSLKATSQSSSKPTGHQPPKATTQSSSRATGQPPKATSQQATSQPPSKAPGSGVPSQSPGHRSHATQGSAAGSYPVSTSGISSSSTPGYGNRGGQGGDGGQGRGSSSDAGATPASTQAPAQAQSGLHIYRMSVVGALVSGKCRGLHAILFVSEYPYTPDDLSQRIRAGTEVTGCRMHGVTLEPRETPRLLRPVINDNFNLARYRDRFYDCIYVMSTNLTIGQVKARCKFPTPL
ncbi:MAG: hypothetical protein M1839_001613 [Geoglossum umbratile]|nr:MAG: hypothetical protein M1839_001613 [Geoglossum umbratile]